MALHRLPCCVILLVVCQLDLPAHAQSLAHAARLARATREQLGPPAKVYTNADVPEAGRVTEPTLAWVARYRALLDAALRRERVLLELLRERQVTQRIVAARSVPPTPAPPAASAIEGIPLSLAYAGYPVFVWQRKAGPHDLTPIWDLHGPRGQHRHARIQTAPRHTRSDTKRPRSSRRPSGRQSAGRDRLRTVQPTPGLPVSRRHHNGQTPRSQRLPGRPPNVESKWTGGPHAEADSSPD